MEEERQAGSTRRDRQIQRKRNEIIQAATQLFSQKSYAGTSTKDIAEAVDIGESTLYNYFENKRDILLAIFNETGYLFDDMLLNVKGIENREALISFYENALDIFVSRIAFTRTLLAQAWLDNEILENHVMRRLIHISELLQSFISEKVKSGVFRPIDPVLGSRLAIGMFVGVLLPVLRGVEPPPAPEQRHRIAEEVVTLLWDGIRAQ